MSVKELFVLTVLFTFLTGCDGCKGNKIPVTPSVSSPSATVKEKTDQAHTEKNEPFKMTSVSPKDNEGEAIFDQPVVVSFNKTLNAKDISKKLIVATQTGTRIKGNITCEDNKLIFKPESPLAGSSVFLAILKKGISSLDGETLKSDYNWRFQTVFAKLPKIRVFSGDSIILSDIAGFDFFNQEISSSSDPVSFKVQNEGVKPLVINSIVFLSGDTSQFVITAPQLPVTLAPKEAFTFSALFKPQTAGKKVVKVRIKNSDEDFGNFNFIMTGRGI
jgi:hypothetical protein